MKMIMRISIRIWLRRSWIGIKVFLLVFLGKVIKYKCESGITTPAKYIKQQNFKEKPDIERGKVAEVDKEMESIRYENSQNKQKDKLEKKTKR